MELGTNPETAHVGRVIQEGLPEEVTFRLRPAGCIGNSHVKSWWDYSSHKRRSGPTRVRRVDRTVKGSFVGIRCSLTGQVEVCLLFLAVFHTVLEHWEAGPGWCVPFLIPQQYVRWQYSLRLHRELRMISKTKVLPLC